jgi:hypothetical protein
MSGKHKRKLAWAVVVHMSRGASAYAVAHEIYKHLGLVAWVVKENDKMRDGMEEAEVCVTAPDKAVLTDSGIDYTKLLADIMAGKENT